MNLMQVFLWYSLNAWLSVFLSLWPLNNNADLDSYSSQLKPTKSISDFIGNFSLWPSQCFRSHSVSSLRSHQNVSFKMRSTFLGMSIPTFVLTWDFLAKINTTKCNDYKFKHVSQLKLSLNFMSYYPSSFSIYNKICAMLSLWKKLTEINVMSKNCHSS